MVFDNDATHLESLGVTTLRRELGDLHVHLVVFLNIHDERTKNGIYNLKSLPQFVVG